MKKLFAMLLALCLAVPCAALAEQAFTAGIYTATAPGKGGDVTVKVTFSDISITDIAIGDNNETPGICENSFDTIPVAIVATQSLAVDTVTGATVTSEAILAAVKEAVVQAGGNPDDMMIAVESAPGEVIAMNADVVIVGAGGAGLSAAVEAARAGASVIVVEAQAYVGGATAMSGGWILAAANEEEAAQYKALTAEQLTEELAIYGSEVHDRELSGDVMAHSIENLNWLIDMAKTYGYEVNPYYDAGYYPLDPGDETTMDYTEVYYMEEIAHQTGGDGYGFWITNTLYEEAKKAGAVFFLNTTADGLLSENGAAAGITASDVSGNTYTISARSVVLACGGFGADKEMATKYNGAQSDYLGPVTNTGWGIAAAEQMGARLEYAYIAAMDEEMIYTDLYNTIGGVVVNGNAEVLKADGTAIPGLYSAGEMACVTVMDPPHFASGHNNAWGIYSGRIAGRQAASNAQ